MKFLVLGTVAIVTLATSGMASAQNAPQVTHGAPIAGVCVYHGQRVLAQSTAGQAIQTGLARLQQEVQGELAPYIADLQQREQTLGPAIQALQGTQPSADLQAQVTEARRRGAELERLAEQRNNELRYTQLVQDQAIGTAVSPIIQAVYQERGCTLLLDRSAVVLGNPAMEITDTVIQRLNTALPTLSFNRLPIPPQLQQQQQ